MLHSDSETSNKLFVDDNMYSQIHGGVIIGSYFYNKHCWHVYVLTNSRGVIIYFFFDMCSQIHGVSLYISFLICTHKFTGCHYIFLF